MGPGIRGFLKRGHFHGGLFASTAPTFGPHGLARPERGMTIKPRGQDDVRRERGGLAGKIAEYELGDILRQMRVAIESAQGDRIDEIDVMLDKFSKGGLGAFACELT